MTQIHRLGRFGRAWRPRRRAWVLVGVGMTLVVVAWYLNMGRQCEGIGFPLDDAWIHQTYARNLARTGRLTYASEQVSLGSTSPLWTALLAVGHLLRVPPVPWADALGVSCWLLLAWVSAALSRRLFPEDAGAALWVGLACLAEWHLAWAALSGLEITLFALLSLWLIERHAAGARPVCVGLIGGLLVWTRPEGIVLVALLLGVVALEGLLTWSRTGWHSGSWGKLPGFVIGFSALWLPYAAMNVLVLGQFFPGTFYAKQAEYQALLALPLPVRLWNVVRQPLIGAQVLLVPGFVWMVYLTCRELVCAIRALSAEKEQGGGAGEPDPGSVPCPTLPRDGQVFAWGALLNALLPAAWWFASHLIYALRLPVGYQHGRYLMPTLPLMLLYGMIGTTRWVRPGSASPRLGVRVLTRTVALALCCLFVAFLVLGGRAFAEDVCIIRGEMVKVALWLRANTPPGALVAAHDIGAIGYFANRPLLDLAGLVTPEVIPFIRDEERLLDYLVEQGADYVATFPSWYPALVRDDRLVRVYQTDCLLTRDKGGDNVAVYRIGR